jgi:hypothetical protein
MKFPVMRYICDTQDSGYGNAARGYIQALRTLGIDGTTCRVVPVMAPTSAPAPMDVSPESHDDNFQRVFNQATGGHDPGVGSAMSTVFESEDPFNPYIMGAWPGDDLINIVHLNPGMAHTYYTPIGNRYNILVTAWETDRLTRRSYKLGDQKRTMVQDINDFDEVWVPTTSLKAIFETCGVTKPIFVIPHAIREEVLAIPPKKTGIPIGKDVPVGFYAIGPWNARKNHLDLIRAYYATKWTISDRVRLQLFTLPVVRDAQSVEAHEWIANDAIRNLKEASPGDKLDLPALSLMAAPRRYMQHIKQAHVANHVFITASRGEGFCLPALDAAALGNHVVGGFPALEDLAEHAPGLVTILDSRQVPITPMPEVAGYEFDHEWWESPIKALTAEFRGLKQWVQEEPLDMDEDVQAVRDHYCPVTIGKLIQARLEHAVDVIESSGW